MADSGIRIEGFIENLSAEKVSGWAWQAGQDHELVLQVFADDHLLGETVADRFRQDLQDAGKGSGLHAFDYIFPEPIAEFTRFGAIRVTVRGTDRALPMLDSVAKRLGIQTLPPPPKPPKPAPPAEAAPPPAPKPPDPDPEPPPAAKPGPVMIPAIPPDEALPSEPDPRPPTPAPAAAAQPAAAVPPVTAQPVATPPAAAPKPAAVVPRVDGLTLRGGALSGRATLEDRRTLILVTADGESIGEPTIGDPAARAADPLLGPRGFRLVVPSALFDGAERRIALFDAASGQRLDGGTVTLRFPILQKPAPAEPPPPKPKPRQPASAAAAALRTLIVTGEAEPGTRAAWLAELCRAAAGEAALVVVGAESRPPYHLPAADIAALVAATLDLAQAHPCATVIVSPPTFPNLLAGILLRRVQGCALVVDIDPASPAAPIDIAPLAQIQLAQAQLNQAGGQAQATAPSAPVWAALAQTLIAEADAVIVANPVLRRRFGGLIVRQGRDEQAFDPARHDRAQQRAAFGYTDSDRVILLCGALGLRDGIVELADALERVADPTLALCVIGTFADPKIEQRLAACTHARIALHQPDPARSAPELLVMADCVAVLQQAAQAEAALRVPSRLIEALAMDVPVLATPAPPLQDLATAGAVQLVADPAQLDAALRSLATASAPPRNRARAVYLAEYSQSVNAARLKLALQSAIPPATTAERADSPAIAALFRLLQTHSGAVLPFLPAPKPARSRRRLPPGQPPPDLVFLASGNDSDLYASRPDMIAAHLLSTGKVRRILHFASKLSAVQLDSAASGRDGDAHRGSLIYAGTVRRVLGLADTAGLIRRTFLHRSGKRAERLMGRDLPPASAYLDFVRSNLAELDSGATPLLWVSGPTQDYQFIRKAVDPALIIADLDEDPLLGSDLAIEPYQPMLADADVVFCSTEPMVTLAQTVRPDIVLIKNASRDAPNWEQQVGRMWDVIAGR